MGRVSSVEKPSTSSRTPGNGAPLQCKSSKKHNNRKRKSHAQADSDQNVNKKHRQGNDDSVPSQTVHSRSQAPHIGIDRVNSNWKQLHATLKKWQKKGKPHISNYSKSAHDLEKTENEQIDHVSEKKVEVLSPKNNDCSLTKVLAMDCEMVGVGVDGKRSIPARISLVNSSGNVVYDKYVKPIEQVTDFRTKISGVRISNLKKGEEFSVVQKEVSELISGRILVGHAIRNDLKILYLSHPKKDIRDTATYQPLKSYAGRPRALRELASEILGVTIQDGEHCSVQDARAALYIYHKYKHEWELSLLKKH